MAFSFVDFETNVACVAERAEDLAMSMCQDCWRGQYFREGCFIGNSPQGCTLSGSGQHSLSGDAWARAMFRAYKYRCRRNNFISPMSSSPSANSRDASPSIVGNSPEPSMCDCGNQLAHWDWNGVPHDDLPTKCKNSIGILLWSKKTSHHEEEGDKSAIECDPEWKHRQ